MEEKGLSRDIRSKNGSTSKEKMKDLIVRTFVFIKYFVNCAE